MLILALALVLAQDTTHAPQRPPDRWLGADKIQHMTMSYSITSFAFAATREKGAAVASAAAVGILKEFYDRSRGRPFSGRDLVWDAIGIALGYTVARQAR